MKDRCPSSQIGAEPSDADAPARRGRAGGFSLIELLTAMAISTIVLTVAVSSVAFLNQQTISLKRRAELDREAKLLLEYLLADVQSAGSGSYRPWSMITVQNNVDGGADRLILAEVDDELGECKIVNYPGSGAVFFMDDSGGCCLANPSAGAWENRRLMAVNGNGSVVKVIVSNSVSTAACQVNFPSGAHALDKLAGSLSDFDGGSLAAVKLRTLRVDQANHQLILEEDLDSNGTTESHVIAEDVYDLQVALGYDANNDGKVASDATSNDEFLYNAAGDAMGSGGLADADVADLRMIQVALVVGARVPSANNSVTVLDGPSRTSAGMLLRAAQGRVHFRNLSLYNQ